MQQLSEGLKQSATLEAKGQSDAVILRAEGDARATVLRATANAEAIERVAEAANKYFNEKAQIWRKLEVTALVLEKNTKFVIPSSADITTLLNLEGDTKMIPLKK